MTTVGREFLDCLVVVNSSVAATRSENILSDETHQRVFESIERRNRELLEDLHSEIEKFISDNDAFFSDNAGSAILKTWHRSTEWEAVCGSRPMSSSVFGVALYKYLREADWTVTGLDGEKFYQRSM